MRSKSHITLQKLKNRIQLPKHARSFILSALVTICVTATLAGAAVLTSCNNTLPHNEGEESIVVRVASLKGPTSIGLAYFFEEAGQIYLPDEDTAEASANPENPEKPVFPEGPKNSYAFNIYGTADEILPALTTGEIDIAVLPANVAAVLHQKTKGGVQVLNINNLGVLYVVSADDSLTSLKDLSNRTVLMVGKGTTPEYVMNALLEASGAKNVNLEYRSEATELAAVISSDPTALAVLPEPYVTAVTTKNPNLAARISLTEAWNEFVPGESLLVTGVTVVRTEFAEAHPEVVAEFIAHQRASVEAVNNNPARSGRLVETMQIIDNAAIAEKAIPRCNLVCLTGTEMKEALEGYLQVLYAQNPDSIGGALPTDDFYYLKD
ncbi:MAG: ABC transporter substrate-binding protein [Coriobacteriales bacterium]|jgi:NitT/TauT family transport system substrate-binding protein|nr:ABC transporter substrate-binding protein [Coriobacteriales bacterium]